MAVSKDDILESISSMSVMEVVELIEAMEEKFGVSAAAAVARLQQQRLLAVKLLLRKMNSTLL
jgi:ribosomal protein L7/L12